MIGLVESLTAVPEVAQNLNFSNKSLISAPIFFEKIGTEITVFLEKMHLDFAEKNMFFCCFLLKTQMQNSEIKKRISENRSKTKKIVDFFQKTRIPISEITEISARIF